MKKVYFVLLVLFCFKSLSQESPAKFANGYSFPIQSKFTIKLDTTDPNNITYFIIKFKTFQTEIDSWENDYLFDKEGDEATIDFYFCVGTSGDTREEREKNQKVHLLFKNRTKLALSYSSEIQTLKAGEYKKSSNIGCYPGMIGNEMWADYIYSIRLSDFKIVKN